MSHEVCVFGEVLADVFPDQSVIGGAPLNVARHLQGLGVHPLLISRVGKDALGEKILHTLHTWGMDTQGVASESAWPTGQVRVHLEGVAPHASHRFEILPNQAYDTITRTHVEHLLRHSSPKVTYFGTLALRSPSAWQACEWLLSNTQHERFLDINLRAPWYSKSVLEHALRHADCLKLNDEELPILIRELGLGLASDDQHIQLDTLRRAYGLRRIVLTCGAKGALWFDAEGIIRLPDVSPLSAMVDTVGAGDAFSAVCIVGQIQGWAKQTILERAHQLAGAVCGIRGATPESNHFYDPFRREWSLPEV